VVAIPSQDIVLQVSQIQEVGKLVRARRQAMGLRQEDVAVRAGLSRSRLLDLEHNNAVEGMSFNKLNALLRVLGLQLAVILRPEPAPAPADVAAHRRNGIRVPRGVKVRLPSIV